MIVDNGVNHIWIPSPGMRKSLEMLSKKGDEMNIEDLTIGKAREIAAMFSQASQPAAPAPHRFIGKYVIARCYVAGVHAGILESADGENAYLKNSRRLYYWKAKEGIALSGVAQNGIIPEGMKVDTMNPEIYLTGVAELIPCAPCVKEQVDGWKA